MRDITTYSPDLPSWCNNTLPYLTHTHTLFRGSNKFKISKKSQTIYQLKTGILSF